MTYALASHILDAINEGRDPKDNGANVPAKATRWKLCYASYSVNGERRARWYRVWRYRHPRSRRTWIEVEGTKLFISQATWRELETRRKPAVKPKPLGDNLGPVGIEIASTLQDNYKTSINNETK